MLRQTTSVISVLAMSALLVAGGCNGLTEQGLKTPTIGVELPPEHNTPDGMVLAADGNIMLSCPNFNDPQYPACIMRITPEDKLEKYYELPVHPETKRACPLGIDFGSDGNLYIADSQALGGFGDYKSRLLKLTIKDGKPIKCESVVEGFAFSNAVACYGDRVYVTETTLVPEPGPGPMESAVYGFDIAELDGSKPITLKRGGRDPHVVCKITTENDEWQVGANGLGFAADGTMYIGNFGNAAIVAVKLDADGKKAVSQKVVAAGGPIKSADGLKVDQKTGLIYLADFLGNAVHRINPKNGKVWTIAQNGLTDGRDGLLDKCSEVCLRGSRVYVSNIDLSFDGNQFDKPYTISVIDLK